MTATRRSPPTSTSRRSTRACFHERRSSNSLRWPRPKLIEVEAGRDGRAHGQHAQDPIAELSRYLRIEERVPERGTS